MVYCGVPSTSCSACRAKKTRCDKRQGGCTQCERAKRVCPGYRVLGDVIFRDESVNVLRRVKAKEARKKVVTKSLVPISTPTSATSDESDTASEWSLEPVQDYQVQLSNFWPTPAIDDRATAFFFTNCVMNDTNGPTRGHLDHLLTIDIASNESIMCAIKAIGLAGFAHASHDPSLYTQARYQYVQAINSVNTALRTPAEAKKDSTLAAIMLLGMFETMTGCNVKSLEAWVEHVRGAIALLKLRGREQFKTKRSRRMFVQTVASLMISLISCARPAPSFILEWMAEARKYLTVPEPSWLVQEVLVEYTNFNAAVNSDTPMEPEAILAKALELDGYLVSLFSGELPPGWKYYSVTNDHDVDLVYRRHYHVYYDSWIAQMWNTMRCLRIMLNEKIRRVLLEGFSSCPPRFTEPEYTAQLQLSTDVVFDSQAEILATVPQHLGYVSRSEYEQRNTSGLSPSPVSADSRQNATLGNASPQLTGPFFLLWPLFFAGAMDSATEEVQQYVVRILVNVGRTKGIQQAAVLAHIVKTKPEVMIWRDTAGE